VTKGEMLDVLSKYAHTYAQSARETLGRNSHMHRLSEPEINALSDEQVRAILNDYINYVGVRQGVDWAMYTKDFL
jgi:hypothetical protein